MSRYSSDFKIRKDYSFSLEAQKDIATNTSEVDLLNEAVRIKGTTISKLTREAIMHYLNTLKLTLDNTVQLDKYLDKENYIPDEPTLSDYLSTHKVFISKSNFEKNEYKRRADMCISLSKLYDEKYCLLRDEEWLQNHREKVNVNFS